MSKRYKITEGGMHDRFHQSMKKVQFIGGGYGNGKTAAVCVKALKLCQEYPGCNGLIARSTYPKLNDTIRREFLKWCPSNWVKRMPTKDDNTLILRNGSTINFRYVAQRGKDTEQSTSNLLSATYDWMIVDQMEDPEFAHKDFMDLMGRLRGNADYIGDDPSMPRVGPRWFMCTLNPTRNWCYREIIKPLHDWKRGIINPKLLVEVDASGTPVLTNGRPTPIIQLFEGSTYENVDNVGEDYIHGMLSTYTGAMRDRFVFGEWGALSGLVYSSFDETVHMMPDEDVREYLRQLRVGGYRPTFAEGYDHGLASPSCYGLFFMDDDGNVFLLDGFHAVEQNVARSAKRIRDIRTQHGINEYELLRIYADPDIFRRKAGGNSQIVGQSVAALFEDEGILLQRGNNAINSGIAKNWQYLALDANHEHPLTGMRNSPHFYVSDKCDWFINEITEYYFKRDGSDEQTDAPTDKRDHAMDMWKYAMTDRPKLAKFIGTRDMPPAYMAWHETERARNATKPRHR